MGGRTIRLAVVLAASAGMLAPLAARGAAAPVSAAACHLGVIKTINFGSYTGAVNFDQRSGEIYVAGSDTVVAINSQTYRASAHIKTGKSPHSIAVNPGTNTIYVANTNSNTLSVINGDTNQVTATVDVARAPLAAMVDRRNDRVYVAGYDGGISVIKSRTGQLIHTIHIGSVINDAALNPVTGLIYATSDAFSGHPAIIFVISVRTGTIIHRIRPGGRPFAVAVNPHTDTVYVTDNPNPGPTAVWAINGSTNRVTATIPTAYYPGFIALNPRNNLVYVVTGTAENDAVFEIDGRTNKVIATDQLGLFSDLTFVGVNAPARLIYVTDRLGGQLVVLAGCR